MPLIQKGIIPVHKYLMPDFFSVVMLNWIQDDKVYNGTGGVKRVGSLSVTPRDHN
jgi:hypothetical protein